jgi:hypothetical protein
MTDSQLSTGKRLNNKLIPFCDGTGKRRDYDHSPATMHAMIEK